MSVQVALLRAVNVGGHGKLPMSELKALATKIGLKNVSSLLQSGNVVFDAGNRAPATIEKLFEAACAKEFGLETSVFVRAPSDLEQLIAANPFPREAKNCPALLHVLFMREAPAAGCFKALQAAIKGEERVRGDARHAYIFYPDGAGSSKLTSSVIARHLQTPGTARNWNTVLKLAALARESA
jgi:uncharacterized protein (DUF1697 family)